MASPAKDRITCHILNTVTGTPARGVRVRLELAGPAPSGHHGAQTKMFESLTDDDGRIKAWLPYSSNNAAGEVPVYTLEDVLSTAEKESAAEKEITSEKESASDAVDSLWTLRFDTEGYFGKGKTFFPEVAVTFRVVGGQHYHVPLLLSPYSYSTYRGS